MELLAIPVAGLGSMVELVVDRSRVDGSSAALGAVPVPQMEDVDRSFWRSLGGWSASM